MRILAIEDDAVYVSLLQAYVGRAGKGIFEVDTVSMLAQGLSRLGEKYYDAVLLDLQLPDSRGPSTVVTVRSQFPNVPIVVLTASDNEQIASEVFENGAQEYLVKGKINVNGVFRILRNVAERKIADDRLRWLESAVEICSDSVIVTENIAVGQYGPRIAFVNQTLMQAFDYSAAEIVGKTFDILFGEKTDPAQLEKVCAAFEKIQPLSAEIVLYRKGERPLWVNLTMSPVPDKAGFLSHWLLLLADISEKKRAQKAAETGGTSPSTAERIESGIEELKLALLTAEQRLRLLHSGAQDQASMVQTLFEDNHELLKKVESLFQEDDI